MGFERVRERTAANDVASGVLGIRIVEVVVSLVPDWGNLVPEPDDAGHDEHQGEDECTDLECQLVVAEEASAVFVEECTLRVDRVTDLIDRLGGEQEAERSEGDKQAAGDDEQDAAGADLSVPDPFHSSPPRYLSCTSRGRSRC